MGSLTNDNHFSILFFRFSGLEGLGVNSYFECLRSIKPLLLDSPEFRESVPGFYVNWITNGDDDGKNSARLTYFTNDEKKTKRAVENFLSSKENNNVELFPSKDCRTDISGNAASGDAEEELRFRTFSNVYSHIGLDLIDENALPVFRPILAHYMSNFSKLIINSGFSPKEKEIDAKSYFRDFFNKNSKFFKDKLDEYKQEQLWKDLSYCPRSSLCFPHFLVNMFAVSDRGEIFVDQ